jgi:SAM-dependent methyltransferase
MLMDAGSSLNHGFVINAPALAGKKVTIVTLAPEAECYSNLGVSYFFGDLRDLEFRDARFDFVVCISTIEHVGMENTMYTGANAISPSGDRKGFLAAVEEMKRILKPGGVFYVTFPFGRYEDHKWFQQFDSALTDTLIEKFGPSRMSETIFRYDPDGWIVSDRASCAQCQFFDVLTSKYFDPKSTLEYPPDYPAGERAVACIEMYK